MSAALKTRAWLAMEPADFKRDFARTIAIADKVQRALIVVTLGAIVAFVARSSDAGERYAIVSAVVLLSILFSSVVIIVPLQRRIIGKNEPETVTETRRALCMKMHLGRTGAAIAAFVLAERFYTRSVQRLDPTKTRLTWSALGSGSGQDRASTEAGVRAGSRRVTQLPPQGPGFSEVSQLGPLS